ncbi:catalase [Streptomyces flavidovirens]|uniref:catalase n=1 Tax=Streptomyces flavidovirens TaxID=67298 RepID=UPI00040F910F|nr:catalase [Streptomyces flavidovirens]
MSDKHNPKPTEAPSNTKPQPKPATVTLGARGGTTVLVAVGGNTIPATLTVVDASGTPVAIYTAGPAGPQITTRNMVLTTNDGQPVDNNQNALTMGPDGPTLLEDFQFVEK